MDFKNKNRVVFNDLVEIAMADPALKAMGPVVEKELLHYEIFQALNKEGLLKDLVFQGGTSLRLCRGSARFSEDLDFSGGVDFSAEKMNKIKECVERHIGEKFGLKIDVSQKLGKVDATNVRVDKWWIAIETSPENRAIPRQKIKLEIANVPAYTREVVPLLANYESVQGMPMVLVNAESIDEIMADKILAFPTSLRDNKGNVVGLDSNKIRHRDIWDLAWLKHKGAKLNPEFVFSKMNDYGVEGYEQLLIGAIGRIPEVVRSDQFKAQLSRFIDSDTFEKTISNNDWLDYVSRATVEMFQNMLNELVEVNKNKIRELSSEEVFNIEKKPKPN